MAEFTCTDCGSEVRYNWTDFAPYQQFSQCSGCGKINGPIVEKGEG